MTARVALDNSIIIEDPNGYMVPIKKVACYFLREIIKGKEMR